MHGLTPEEEIDYWRERARRAEAAGAWKPSEVWREEVADEVAEQIAAFVGEFMDTEPVGDWRLLPRQIRANAWRPSPATDKEE